MTPTQTTSQTRQRVDRVPPQVLRCACVACGAHSNAIKTSRVFGSCPNCGSYDLAPVENADPLGGALRAA